MMKNQKRYIPEKYDHGLGSSDAVHVLVDSKVSNTTKFQIGSSPYRVGRRQSIASEKGKQAKGISCFKQEPFLS